MRLFNYPFLHRWRWLPPLLLGLVIATSTVSHAQANDAQHVVVTLRDASNYGLDQVVVSMKASEGNVLAEGITDRDGAVRLSFPNSTSTLRLSVRGVNATGTSLQLAASERDGITVRLQAPATAISLRVEDDGTVLPDPATMAEPEGIPLPPASTRQPPAPTAADATSEPAYQQPAPTEFVDANGQAIADTPPTPDDAELLVGLAWLMSVIAVVVWLIFRPMRGG